jgi:hypothetical protein
MQVKINQYNDILDRIIDYLSKFRTTNHSDLEAEYFRYIEQDSEKLLNFMNDGIIDLPLYEKVRKVFIILINMTKEYGKENMIINIVLNDLYYNLKYVYESILFIIENEFLQNN